MTLTHVELCEGCAAQLWPLLETPPGRVREATLLHHVAQTLALCRCCAQHAVIVWRAAREERQAERGGWHAEPYR